MKTYNTVTEYKQNAKENDIIIFEGRGIIDGIKTLQSKYDTHKVKTINPLRVTAYRGRTLYRVGEENQQIAVINKTEFKNLEV